MSLKYKIGDIVVLGENVDAYNGFLPGVKARVGEVCFSAEGDNYYTIYHVDGEGRPWWVEGFEVNHEATEALQAEMARSYIREPINVAENSPLIDDNAKEVRTPALDENAPQTAIQGAVEGSFASVYSSVSVFRKGSVKEGDSVFCSEGSTTISIVEDCVKFLVFEQDGREIYLDFDEVEAVFSAAKKLMLQYNNVI